VAIGSFVEQVNRKNLCCAREILGIIIEELSLWLQFSFPLICVSLGLQQSIRRRN
jgi:hypothetical protein